MANRHAVFVTTDRGVTFRVGQPLPTYSDALDRWDRLDRHTADYSGDGRGYVKHQRRKYRARFAEVRAVDDHGRGLGSERHATAIHVPCRLFRVR